MLRLNRSRLTSLAILAGLLLGQAGWLWAADYSRAWMSQTTLVDALQPDSPLALGNLDWNPALYADQPRLAPFAAVVRQHCSRPTVLETVVCLSDLLAERFPHGTPHDEVFSAGFDPAATLHRHLAGEPGHCVSRSGILSAALLSVGIPARLVQLVPSFRDRNDRRRGHNAIEVWDRNVGWVFFDPSYGGTVKTAAGEQSAAALLAAGGGLTWVQLGKVPRTLGKDPLEGQRVYEGNPTPRFNGHLVYPEPWLYTRVGHKQAPALFNGSFLVVGSPSLRLAFGHWLLLGALAGTGLALAGGFVGLIRDLLRTAAPLARGSVDDAAARPPGRRPSSFATRR